MSSNKKLKLIIVAIISVVCLFGTVYFSYMNQLNKGLYDNYDTIVDDAVYIINEDDTSIYSKEQLSYVADNNITAAYYQKEFYIIDEASKCNVWVINKECKKYGIPTNFNIFISIEHIDLIPNKVYMSDLAWNVYDNKNIINIGDIKYKDGMETKPKSIALSFVYIPDFVFDAPVKMIYSGKNIEIPEEVSTSVSDLYNPDTIGYATGNVIKEVETNRNKNVFTIWRTIFIVSEVITLFAITPIISYYMVSMYKSSMIKRIFFMKKRSFVNECFMSVFLIIPINILGCILFPLIISKGVDSENIFYLIVSTVVLIIEVYLVLNYSAKKIYSKNLDKLKFGENI